MIDDNAVRCAIYESFIERGRAPLAWELASALEAPVAEVEASFQRLHDAHVIVLAPGTPYVWLANPFSGLPSPFTVSVGGATRWGICIWDALGVVALMGGSGTVSTLCPCCNEEIVLEVDSGRLTPVEGVVHYTVPARHWWDDIGFT